MLNDMSNMDKALSEQAERITLDSGDREVNEATGFNRDVQDGKFKFTEHDAYIIEYIDDALGYNFHEHIDREKPLNTGYDEAVTAVESKNQAGVTTAIQLERTVTTREGTRWGSRATEQLIHPLLLNRVQALLMRGAEKYGAGNWEKGNNLSRSFDSLFRHIMQWYLGDTSEDHLAGAVCNLMFLMVHENNLHERKNFGKDHPEFADAGALWWDNLRYDMPDGLHSFNSDEQRKRMLRWQEESRIRID